VIEAHLLLPTELLGRLKRFQLCHRDGYHGYFATMAIVEFWAIIRGVVDSGYRVDITPGSSYRVMARKEPNV
jgi:hypothetical protein